MPPPPQSILSETGGLAGVSGDGRPAIGRRRNILPHQQYVFHDADVFRLGPVCLASLERKGGVSFLRDRLLRLGVPFLFGAMVIPPIAHFASCHLQTSDEPTFGAYWRAWWALSDRPIGPMWFNAMLLVFDFAAVGLLAIAEWVSQSRLRHAGERPARFFAVVLILSALADVPLALAYGDGTWTQWGLFQFQTSRPVHYFVYFIMGVAVAVGVHGLREGSAFARWHFGAAVADMGGRGGRFPARWWCSAVATMTSEGT